MKGRKQINLPPEVYNNLIKHKIEIEKDLSVWSGKNRRLTMPKFLNALVKKDSEIRPIIPFNYKELDRVSRRKRGEYE